MERQGALPWIIVYLILSRAATLRHRGADLPGLGGQGTENFSTWTKSLNLDEFTHIDHINSLVSRVRAAARYYHCHGSMVSFSIISFKLNLLGWTSDFLGFITQGLETLAPEALGLVWMKSFASGSRSFNVLGESVPDFGCQGRRGSMKHDAWWKRRRRDLTNPLF